MYLTSVCGLLSVLLQTLFKYIKCTFQHTRQKIKGLPDIRYSSLLIFEKISLIKLMQNVRHTLSLTVGRCKSSEVFYIQYLGTPPRSTKVNPIPTLSCRKISEVDCLKRNVQQICSNKGLLYIFGSSNRIKYEKPSYILCI